MEDSTGLLRTDCKKVSRPGVTAPAEDGILFGFLILQYQTSSNVKVRFFRNNEYSIQLDLH